LPAFVRGGVNIYVLINICVNPSAEKLRAKSEKTVQGSAAVGHTTFAKRGPVSDSAIFAAPGFT
jgi:hypothetical protein